MLYLLSVHCGILFQGSVNIETVKVFKEMELESTIFTAFKLTYALISDQLPVRNPAVLTDR